ncbi:hypothetical protein [Neorhizobium sp. DAR64860/K0K1]|uniref:8-oxoguanine DNA glycosylase n=1 Tax=Neorhizobium sp. DAR64860/K0K1 TaxID=3421955 RepID=UPI003D297E63
MQLIVEDALSGLIQDFRAGIFSHGQTSSQRRATKVEVRQTLISCLLSSGWKYEKSLAASELFVETFPTIDETPNLADLEDFLCQPRVRHRFPKIKAKQLHSSLSELATFPFDMMFKGSDIKSERIVRAIIQRRFSGFGYKQTSMFMRNIGAANSLAVIDSHIIWYLKTCFNIEAGTITPKRYIDLENIVHNAVSKFDIDLNSFDVILWVLVREFKKNERMKACGTQYVLPLVA